MTSRRDPTDRRGLKIALTDDGYALAEEMVESHVATEESMLSALTDKERVQIRRLLAKIA